MTLLRVADIVWPGLHCGHLDWTLAVIKWQLKINETIKLVMVFQNAAAMATDYSFSHPL